MNLLKKIQVLAGGLILCFVCTGCGGTAQAGHSLPKEESISKDLQYEGRMALDYAEEFAVDYYSDGFVLASVSDGSRFLVVPENEKVPEDLAEDIIVLQQPVENIYLVASAVMDMFRSLDSIDRIRLSGTKAESWYVPEAKNAMERGDILYAGKYSAPDYERILDQGCRLAVENTMINHAPEVREKLEAFGIPVLVDYSSYESHPLGRTEWVKFYGAILGKEEAAEAAFEEQSRILTEISSQEKTGKTVAFFYITTSGSVNVRKSSDYVPKMIELAGGSYVFKALGDDESRSSSVNMQMEEFYAKAREADYLIYNSTIDGELQSVEELIGKWGLLRDFKAVQTGNVWCTSNDFYQASMSLGTFISDIHQMLMNGEAAVTEYIYPLQ